MNRRQFITQTGQTALATSLLGSLLYPAGAALAADAAKHPLAGARPEELEKLFATWTDGLLARQIGPEADRESAGALACPACGFIHGRGGDAIYPLLRRARISKDERFTDAAVRLFNWMACMDDKDTGGWINNLKPLSTWNGITTFSLITLCEALHYHGDLLPAPVRQRMTERAVKAADFDAVVIPGGWAPDKLRRHMVVTNLVREMNDAKKPIGIICHGGLVAISAGIVRGRCATGSLGIKDDLVNAGAHYVDEEVVVDGNLITSRKPDDLPAFMKEVLRFLKTWSA